MRKSPFRRQVEKDFLTTFLNVDEYGYECDWNGGKLLIAEGALDSAITEEVVGLLHNTKRVYCRAKDLPALPRPDEPVRLDGVPWLVKDSRELFGHFEILLIRESSA